MNYLDINVFVYWLTDHPDFGETATGIIERVEMGEKGVTSSLTPWLINVVLEREVQDYSPKLLMENLLSIRNLRITPLKITDYEKACSCAEQYGLDFEDAIHLSVALEEKAEKIYSNDEDFDDTPLKRVFE